MAIFTNRDYEPDDDPAPWGFDWQGDKIEVGEEDVVLINSEYVRLDDAADWIVANSTPVNTEDM
ncbi:hypothetical protein BKY29_02675 [Weissella confusa]|uniref:hypothetical protein n=1 Tax=Weissella confusa TaxID=1583 RepID=UPI0008FE733E|nr:hypothetical protein [Weissella confusa]OJF04141.1 hypothetical protein BKY29_02675 [Weissella confusa]